LLGCVGSENKFNMHYRGMKIVMSSWNKTGIARVPLHLGVFVLPLF
jgi:hypothetical protein